MLRDKYLPGTEQIFNHNEPKNFWFIKSIVSYKKKGTSIEFICKAEKRESETEYEKGAGVKRVKVKLNFYSGDMFRLQMSPYHKSCKKENPILMNENLKAAIPSIEEKHDKLTIKHGNIILNIKKQPWQICVNDKDGKTVFAESVSNMDGLNRFDAYPLGFSCDRNNSNHSVYETISLHPEEHIYGLGEKFLSLDKKGQKNISWTVDPHGITTSDLAYKNIPFFMNNMGYGIFINSTYKIIYEMGNQSSISYSFSVEDSLMDYFFIYGPTFKKILYKYTGLTGRAPVPPKWSFGLWMSKCAYGSRKEVEEVCRKLRQLKIPCDVIHIDPPWLGIWKKKQKDWCGDLKWDEKSFPNPREMITNLGREGFKLCLWENPYVLENSETYREGLNKGYFPKTSKGTIAKLSIRPNYTLVDFSNPEAVEWYKEKHRKLLRMGVAVFKTDYGEWAPVDAVYYNGMHGREMHNLYPLLYNKAVFEVTKEFLGKGLVWGRSAYAGSQRYPVYWAGDSQDNFYTMASVLRGGLSFGLSGIPFWSHDIGGFERTSFPQLYIRWAQFGLFSSHSRCHGCAPREPWAFGENALRIFRKYAKLRYRLIPYIYSYAHIASKTGLPIIRAMMLEYQDDPNIYDKELQYMFGEELLVAPIFDSINERNIYLPKGRWMDYWNKKEYDGPVNIKYRAPLETLPVFIREDSIIPYGPDMNYIGEKPFDRYLIEIYLSNKANFTIYDDDETIRLKAVKKSGHIVIDISSSKNGGKEYQIMLYKIKPDKIKIGSKPLRKLSNENDLKKSPEGWTPTLNGTKIKYSTKGTATIFISLSNM